jgi:hypothetical protein
MYLPFTRRVNFRFNSFECSIDVVLSIGLMFEFIFRSVFSAKVPYKVGKS